MFKSWPGPKSFAALAALSIVAVSYTACASQRGANANCGHSASDGRELVSFNDGTLVCDEIEISAYANKRDISNALQEGSRIVAESGCVNFAFVE